MSFGEIARWGLDVKLAVGSAIVAAAMAVLQLLAAGASLRAAWKIAADQKTEADRQRQAASTSFIEAVSALAREALFEADKADSALRAGGPPNGIVYNFGQRLEDLHEALQPIRSAAPPDAKLMLAVGRLSRVMRNVDAAGLDGQTAIQLVGRHRGSIGLALGEIQAFAGDGPAPDLVIPTQTGAPTDEAPTGF